MIVSVIVVINQRHYHHQQPTVADTINNYYNYNISSRYRSSWCNKSIDKVRVSELVSDNSCRAIIISIVILITWPNNNKLQADT